LPLGELPDLKSVAPYYYEWLRHPPGDPWWDWAEIRGKYGRVSAAVLNLSGWYDEAYGPEGATTNFSGLVAARRGQKDLRTQLVIGPWTHGVEETSKTKAGEREFGPRAWIDYDEVVLRWMDRYVRGIDNGVDREKPVRVFVMGRPEWREEDAWPLKKMHSPSLYLTTVGTPEGDQGRLSWKAPGRDTRGLSFISDPSNPVVDPFPPYSGAHDYRRLLLRPDVLDFHSEPLDREMEITGPVTAEIFLSCDAPDTDLWVRLLDMSPDGTAYNLMSPGLDVIRASFRNGGPRRELLSPGHVYKLRLTNLITSNLFEEGHRIGVQISTTFFPHFSRNLHAGEMESTASRMQKATIRIYCDRQRPSRLILPVIGGPVSVRAGRNPSHRD
jgi:hypothetical protein